VYTQPWLEEIVKPFSDPQTRVVSGYYKGLPQNIFQKCLIPYVLVMPDKAGKTEFLPSTRSMAISRSVLDQSGGFDIKLNHNEDYAYAHWLKKMGIKFIYAPKAIVGWMPRKNLLAAWMFAGSPSRCLNQNHISKVNCLSIPIFVYIFMLCLQIISLFIPLGIICLMYLGWSIVKNYRFIRHPMAFFWLPVLQLTADISVMFGTMVGFMAKVNGLF
jgi:GT2 family glycosyltransferase